MPRTITPAEAAKKLNVGRNFVYDLLVSGKLRAEKGGSNGASPKRRFKSGWKGWQLDLSKIGSERARKGKGPSRKWLRHIK